VIVLKDVNAPDSPGEFNLRMQLETDPHPWWSTVANWCAAMSACPETPRWSDLGQVAAKDCLERFAFMQVKKSVGAGSVREDTLIDFARRDADMIREQLRIYRPHVIVGCGIGKILASILEGTKWRQTQRGVWYVECTLDVNLPTSYLIDYMHPSARAMKSVVCFGLLDAYREIIDAHGLRAAHPSV